MANLYTSPPGQPMAELAAQHVLAAVPPERLAQAVLLLPTRRACVTMREAFQTWLGDKASLLPRMYPLADIDAELLTLLGPRALDVMETIPPAMPDWQQRYLLTVQIRAFETRRLGGVTLDHALALADELMALHDLCARSGVTLSADKLRPLAYGDMATHWEQSLQFLAILSDYWPEVERAHGLTTKAAREVRVMEALADAWHTTPPDFPVFAIGSTASQESTARLLQVIAEMPNGAVILPGLDPEMTAEEWTSVGPGHPLHHLKQFLERFPVEPPQVKTLIMQSRGAVPPPIGGRLGGGHEDTPNVTTPPPQPSPYGGGSLWLTALSATEQIPKWGDMPLPEWNYLRLIPCAHAEEEARVIALLLREALEFPLPLAGEGKGEGLAVHPHGAEGDDGFSSPRPSPAGGRGGSVALITPDERLMDRVAAHLRRYGIVADRLKSGTLGTTQTGSLWEAITSAIAEPDRLLNLRSFLHHPLIDADRALLELIEPYWYGTTTHRVGQLPRMPEAVRAHHAMPRLQKLVQTIARLSRAELTTSAWITQITALLAPLVPQSGEGHTAVEELLDAMATADMLGPMTIDEFRAVLAERLAQPWRNQNAATHPALFMLTPVEARLQHFDRVILANMQEQIWPGLNSPNAWLNFAAQKALGLPAPEERISLMAHDVLMLASAGEVFLTYPKRDGGSPAARSRFIERLVTLLAMQGVEEKALHASQYTVWANALDAAEAFTPAPPVMPLPPSEQRPRSLPVSALDKLFTDPFSIYARHVLGLKPLKEMDAEPEASDFGSLAHKAIQALTDHWNMEARAAEEGEIAAIADRALRDFSDRPNVALFWRTRLIRALNWVNALEAERRPTQTAPVESELPVEGELQLGEGESITLQGRIDRREQGSLIDYKTGDAPSEKDMLEGHALQLLAYAMLVDGHSSTRRGEDGRGAELAPSLLHDPLEQVRPHPNPPPMGERVATLEYWSLPRGNKPGSITQVGMEALTANDLPVRLRSALADMLKEATPFLARPIPTASRYANDYDGISRYDEWAG